MEELRKHKVKLKHMGLDIKSSNNQLSQYKWLVIIGAAVILVLIGEFVLILKSRITPPQPANLVINPSVKQIPALPVSAQVMVTSQGFTPATLMVKTGTQVNWVSQDKKPHQIASDPHPLHNLLTALFQKQPALSFSYTFTQVGTFSYHDEKNPLKFLGTIIVK